MQYDAVSENSVKAAAVRDYLYQIMMRDFYTDISTKNLFNKGLICKTGIGS